MMLCAAIVNHENARLKLLTSICLQKGVNIRVLRNKLLPAAKALGLSSDLSPFQDLYRVLEIKPTASAHEIKTAFRRKAIKIHPDANFSEASQGDEFIKLNEAYRILSNPATRRRYDQRLLEEGLWHEQYRDHPKPPKKSNYFLIIGAFVLIFILAAFVFDFLFYKEDLFNFPDVNEQLSSNTANPNASSDHPNKNNDPSKAAHKAPGLDNQTTKQKTSIKIGLLEFFDTEKKEVLLTQAAASSHHPRKPKRNQNKSKPGLKKQPRATLGLNKNDDPEHLNRLSMFTSPQIDANTQPPRPSTTNRLSSSASESRDNAVLKDTKFKIEKFLDRYCQAHEHKNLEKLASFYKADAIENGVLFQTLLNRYRSNLAMTDSIQYTISMHNYAYLSNSRDIQIKGRFLVRWREYGGNWKSNSGSVMMQMEQSKDSFLIKQVYYQGNGGPKALALPFVEISPIDQPMLKSRVEKFLNLYCQTYASKNLKRFAAFFSSNASENGKPFHITLPQHRHNFSIIDTMTYQIVMHRLTHQQDELIKISGAFSLRWRQYDGHWRKNSGNISMRLRPQKDSFRIEALNYRND